MQTRKHLCKIPLFIYNYHQAWIQGLEKWEGNKGKNVGGGRAHGKKREAHNKFR